MASKKNMMAIIPEKNVSDFPKKDSTKGKNNATTVRARKNIPAVTNPEKPILPERYQKKFL